jgi:N-acetyl-anhydromuramyl-L-alanine amidase AmpD
MPVVLAWAQRLRINLPRAAAPLPDKPRALGHTPEETDRELEAILAIDADAPSRRWTAVVFHHSGTPTGSAQSFDAYHRAQKGWSSLAYDFVIGNGTGTPDGAIETGPRWRQQQAGAHAHSVEFNEHGIGICLVGNFEEAPPTPAQVHAAKLLVQELCRRSHIPRERIFGHAQVRDGSPTACPGKHFPLEEIRGSVPEE